MELEQLRQLVEIKRQGTISAAADALLISQPALSRSIKRLERDLGQQLFERTKNSVRFNEAGELALGHANEILGDVRKMREDFDELSRRQRTLQVASVAPAPNWRFSALALQRDPGTILEPEMMDARDVVQALLNREAAFAITLRPIQLPNVRSHPLMTEDLYLNAPAGSDLAGRSSISFSDIDGRPLLIFEQIGFWMGMVRRDTPHSQVIVQKDRTVFLQLVQSTDLLSFTSDAPENGAGRPAGTAGEARAAEGTGGEGRPASGRVSIPITDADAHVTFFLSIMADAPEEVRAIFDWVSERAEEGGAAEPAREGGADGPSSSDGA